MKDDSNNSSVHFLMNEGSVSQTALSSLRQLFKHLPPGTTVVKCDNFNNIREVRQKRTKNDGNSVDLMPSERCDELMFFHRNQILHQDNLEPISSGLESDHSVRFI